MKLQDKVALITGGTSGIGEAIATAFAREGAKVAVVGAGNREKAAGVAERVGNGAKPFVADIRSVEAINGMVAEVIAAFGRIDILVNSAGVFYPTPVGETNEADYDRMMDINVKGTFFTIEAVAPIMKRQGGGKIINLSSVTGVMAFNTYAAYCATKAAINYMTKAHALELAPHGINVNAILPGNTATPMNENVRTAPEFKTMLDTMAERTPSGRTYSAAEDMAAAAVYLASDDSRAMYGGLMLIDEGISLGM